MGGLYSRRALTGGIGERELQRLALKALEGSDLGRVMQLAGGEPELLDEAGAALKAVLAERIVEYTIRAMGEAKKRKISMGAAAVILGSR
jgi:hypothetical protein